MCCEELEKRDDDNEKHEYPWLVSRGVCQNFDLLLVLPES